MKKNELEAVRLLGVYTARSFNLDRLLGNARASVRAHIMSELVGVKTPQSKSGYNALRSRFNELGAIEGTCIADRETKFIDWCKGIEAQNGWAQDPNYGRK